MTIYEVVSLLFYGASGIGVLLCAYYAWCAVKVTDKSNPFGTPEEKALFHIEFSHRLGPLGWLRVRAGRLWRKILPGRNTK